MTICVGIAGGTACGKSTLARAVAARFAGEATVIEYDWYYRDQDRLCVAEREQRNYDHPDALETDLLVAHLDRLTAGEAVHAPQYDFARHTRAPETRLIEPHAIVLIEGIHVLSAEPLRKRLALKIFIDADADLRFIRRLRRDLAERGRTAGRVIDQYLDQVRPMHLQFVEPTRACADLVVAGEGPWQDTANRIAEAIHACRSAAGTREKPR